MCPEDKDRIHAKYARRADPSEDGPYLLEVEGLVRRLIADLDLLGHITIDRSPEELADQLGERHPWVALAELARTVRRQW